MAAVSNQKTAFDGQMAKAALEAREMKVAYDKLTCDNAEQREMALQVCGAEGGGLAGMWTKRSEETALQMVCLAGGCITVGGVLDFCFLSSW